MYSAFPYLLPGVTHSICLSFFFSHLLSALAPLAWPCTRTVSLHSHLNYIVIHTEGPNGDPVGCMRISLELRAIGRPAVAARCRSCKVPTRGGLVLPQRAKPRAEAQ
ncbi:hypothetical protein BDY21DRAFT_24111 [Lineolata rhizophorae]|uniref:Secreted protein n=1 Tax=Lineolata rhizophorae TaxID=578093 RepID=A0A6A6P0V8_9PEZI|nr:hypothetical protein BDY21DRAFT_24111 [Lineolata rhizophorae]